MSTLAAAIQKFTPRGSSRRVGHIGLECALTEMHLVQLAADSAGRIAVHALASIPYPVAREEVMATPAVLRTLVHQAFSGKRFKGRRVVTTLPAADTHIMPLSYHVSGGQSAEAALLAVIGERLDGALAEYVIDYLPVRADRKSEERSAIIAVARRDTVIAYLELLRKSGLQVERLDIGPAAIRRLISALNRDKGHENVLAINFGRNASYLTVISGSRLLYDQEIPFGEQKLLEKIATTLEISLANARELVREHSFDATSEQGPARAGNLDLNVAATLQEIVKPAFMQLAEEITRTQIYTASQTHGETLSRIYLLGSLARWRGTDALLNDLVRLDVQTIPNPLQPFNPENVPAYPAPPSPEIAVATGLALSGLSDHV